MKITTLITIVIIINASFCSQASSQTKTANLKSNFPESSEPLSLDSILTSPGTGVILTLGQSNAANYGQGPYSPKFNSYVLTNETLSLAKDPLSGTDGSGTSVWTRLADLLIEKEIFKNVIVIPIAIGSTEVSCWSRGDCNKKLTKTLATINNLKIKINYIIWHQGESDNLANTSFEEYKNSLNQINNQIFNSIGTTPTIVSIASYHPGMIGIKPNGTDESIRKAQISFINENKNTIKGPDTDEYNKTIHRHDGVHFSRLGLDIFAKDLYQTIKRSKNKNSIN